MKNDHVMQFKVSLKELKPPIWRRILVPCTYTFWDLHVAIQDAMGWRDSHLHEYTVPFPITGEPLVIGIPDLEGFDDDSRTIPGWQVPVASFFTLLSRKAAYVYDFGDGWEHRVVLEKIIPAEKGQKLPECIGGRRACPPEDCGGVQGYYELCAVLEDPDDPEFEEMSEWVGGAFDPADFDKSEVVFHDPVTRWRDSFQ